MPYLQDLQDKSEFDRKYRIDDDLGRHSKALVHLHSLSDFEKLQAYTKKYSLYAEALDLYKYKPDQYGVILRLYAEHLNTRNRYKEAAIGKGFHYQKPAIFTTGH